MTIEAAYSTWRRYDQLIVDALHGLSAEDLALRASAGDHWPIWAIAAHPAGTRVYWLCHVLGEPGADSTPFTDPAGYGWEDDLDHPRSAAELVRAWTSSGAVIERCLATWTPAMLDEALPRTTSRGVEHHTRRSVLQRLMTHDAYHVGEIALIQGMHGQTQIDLWPPGSHTTEEAARLG